MYSHNPYINKRGIRVWPLQKKTITKKRSCELTSCAKCLLNFNKDLSYRGSIWCCYIVMLRAASFIRSYGQVYHFFVWPLCVQAVVKLLLDLFVCHIKYWVFWFAERRNCGANNLKIFESNSDIISKICCIIEHLADAYLVLLDALDLAF